MLRWFTVGLTINRKTMTYAFENMRAWQEAYNQLIIAADLEYIGNEQLKNIQPQIDVVARMMNGLRTSLVQ